MRMSSKKRRNWIFCLVAGLLTIALCFLPDAVTTVAGSLPRVRVRVQAVDNSQLMPLGIVYSGVQGVTCEVLEGAYKGRTVQGSNYLNAALDKDKLYVPGDTAIAMQVGSGESLTLTLVDHDRIGKEALLLAAFGLLLILFGGVSGCGALISLALSGVLIWKVMIPQLLAGNSPVWLALALVTVLTAFIDVLVAGLHRQALVAFLGSMLGTALTCLLAFVVGDWLKLDGGQLPYVVPLLSQSTMQLNTRELFFAMVFISNSGALMDLSMDVAASCREVREQCPALTRRELMQSGFRVGRSVIGTMSTTLLLAYSGSYLSMLMYFAGQGTPLVDILSYKYVASEVLITLVGSFGLVTVAPFTAIVSSFLFPQKNLPAAAGETAETAKALVSSEQ